MNCRDIIRKYLEANGFDGLCYSDGFDGCGCGREELFPCDEDFGNCEPANEEKYNPAEHGEMDAMPGDTIYVQRKKDSARKESDGTGRRHRDGAGSRASRRKLTEEERERRRVSLISARASKTED